MSQTLREWLRHGQPESKRRNEQLIRALLPAMSHRVANPDQPQGFGSPLRFVVRVDDECLAVVATVLPENENVMHLDIAPEHPIVPKAAPVGRDWTSL